jgi:hypothetical protein
MCNKFIESVEAFIDNWKPRERFEIIKVDTDYHKTPVKMGVI